MRYLLSECCSFPVEAGKCTRCHNPCLSFEVTREKYGYNGAGGLFYKHELLGSKETKEFISSVKKYEVIELSVTFNDGFSCLYYEGDDPTEKMAHMPPAEFHHFCRGRFYNTPVIRDKDGENYNYASEDIERYNNFIGSINPNHVTDLLLQAVISELSKYED